MSITYEFWNWGKKNGYVCTDDEFAQFRKDLGNGVFELVQIDPLPRDFGVCHGLIDVNAEDYDAKQTICDEYGYDTPEQCEDGIMAECIFETFLCDYYDEEKHPFYPDINSALDRIHEIIGD